MSFISKLRSSSAEPAELAADTQDAQDSEDFEWALTDERRRLCKELAGYRNELIHGFSYPSRKARCSAICLRLTQIDLLLSDEE